MPEDLYGLTAKDIAKLRALFREVETFRRAPKQSRPTGAVVRGPNVQLVRVTGAGSGARYPAKLVLRIDGVYTDQGDVWLDDANLAGLDSGTYYLSLLTGQAADNKPVFTAAVVCCVATGTGTGTGEGSGTGATIVPCEGPPCEVMPAQWRITVAGMHYNGFSSDPGCTVYNGTWTLTWDGTSCEWKTEEEDPISPPLPMWTLVWQPTECDGLGRWLLSTASFTPSYVLCGPDFLCLAANTMPALTVNGEGEGEGLTCNGPGSITVEPV